MEAIGPLKKLVIAAMGSVAPAHRKCPIIIQRLLHADWFGRRLLQFCP